MKFVFLLAVFGGCLLSACTTIPTSREKHISANSINYSFRKGEGPVIVFQSGLGDGKEVWDKTLKHLPTSAAVFSYDRPGYGKSPAAQGSRDPCTISRELHTLLQAVKVPPPYILVGHSLGGLQQFCYASLFPDEVAGLVLLDPTHPNHWNDMRKDAKSQANLIRGLKYVAFTPTMRQEFDGQNQCLTTLNIETGKKIPATLLFSGKFQIIEKGAFEAMLKKLRKEWEHLLVNTTHREIADSGHYIQKDAPETVAAAVKEMMANYTNKTLLQTSP